MNDKGVTHKGIVKSVSGDNITILTDGECSCDGCAVAMLCNKTGGESEGQTGELITVSSPDASRFSPGQTVELTASSGSTLSAAWWALILPSILFIGTVLGIRLGWEQSGGWSIVAGFVVLGVYDLGLYLFRRQLGSNMVWRVRQI
ncbi:MAG: SoxR reducing system RseC family protein [Duncaniella sp.]|nr:SoxR reducing system RseC family protein [Duncaniella sp.]